MASSANTNPVVRINLSGLSAGEMGVKLMEKRVNELHFFIHYSSNKVGKINFNQYRYFHSEEY